MKKKTYVPSKSISEKADAILGQMRRKQAVEDLLKSNKKLGIVAPKSLSVSTSQPTQTQAISSTKSKSRKNNNNH